MFPLQPALTGGQDSSKILHKMFELPCALPQFRLCPKAPPMHREILWPGQRGREAHSSLCNSPQPIPTTRSETAGLGEAGSHLSILSCHFSSYCSKSAALVQSTWVCWGACVAMHPKKTQYYPWQAEGRECRGARAPPGSGQWHLEHQERFLQW